MKRLAQLGIIWIVLVIVSAVIGLMSDSQWEEYKYMSGGEGM